MALRWLVPTREHAKASESVQLKADRMILGCPLRTSSHVARADLGVRLFSSRRDIATPLWQHRLHGLSADRLERVLYDGGLQAPAQGRGRNRRMESGCREHMGYLLGVHGFYTLAS